MTARSLAWTGYAAFAWAAVYAVAVRGYHGLGGTFADPAGMRRTSLIAGAGILLVGVGAPGLGFSEPWFLGLGVLVTLAALHHHLRSGGSARDGRRLMAWTAIATLALTAFACTLVVLRS